MALSLRINIVEKSVTKTLQFDPATTIFDACKVIRDKCSELPDLAPPKDYGLFLPGELYGTGAWLEPGKTLDYYLLRNGDTIEYRRKIRTLRVRTLDGAHKTLMVDDSQIVTNLMVVICTKMGITNHDEYSLVRDLPDENDSLNRPENYGTLTLRRKKEEREKDVKMDQLRKKLKTDDEINWIDHTKTLREQGVEEHEVLLLRRKYFFSDQNIDSHDPVQLNLLYVQARDAILDGTHPITQDKACEFAGIQCQIQFGDHNPQKHRPGFLDLKDFLPTSYVKTKGIEKKVFAEHRKHLGLTELDSKALYTKNARSLDTYGVTFFLVKEKVPGKNKLVPRLLGVTKDSVLRLDERTKEILKTWPLTTVRRWAASPNTFTLDFGDYSDQYYSVQTPEGEQIAQLIAGYIDIILKKKQAKDHLGIEGDEGSTLFEEIVSPFQATTVQRQVPAKPTPLITDSVAKPAVINNITGLNQIHTGSMQGAQYTTTRGSVDVAHSPQPSIQRVHTTETISRTQKSILSGRDAIARSHETLDTPLQLPPIGDDPESQRWKEDTLDSKRQNVQSQIAAMSAATAHMVTITSSRTEEQSESNETVMDETVSAISSGLPAVAKDVRMLAALMDDSGDKLIDATKKLCSAFSELLNAVEPDTKEPRQNLLSAAGKVGDASRVLLNTIDEGDESQDLLLGLAKGVANSSAKLVVSAKQVASTVEDQYQKEEIIASAAQTALSASELVACAKVVAPTINNEKCRIELISATRKVSQAVESVLTACNNSTADKGRKQDLQAAAREVSESLNRLVDHIRPASRVSAHDNLQEGAVDTILVATDKIITSDDSGDMVRQARILAQATAQLIQAIKGEAEKTSDSDLQRKLIAAAKVLADATSQLVEAAKSCASNPNAPASQDLLRQAAQDVREATNMAAGGALQKKTLKKLESSAKNAAAAAAQCIASSQSASSNCPNATTRDAMSSDCRAVADTIPKLISAVKSSLHSTDESTQLNLIEATERFLGPSQSLVQTTKNACSFIGDPSTSRHLTQSSQKLAVELVELRTALERMKADSGLYSSTSAGAQQKQLTAAATRIREVKDELVACRKAAARNELRPLPGDTPQNAIQRLTMSIKKVETCTDQLVTSVVTSDQSTAGSSAQGISSGLSDLVQASRAVAATSGEPMRVLTATEEALERCWTLLRESGALLNSAISSNERQTELDPLSRGVHEALIKVSNSIPGQKEIEDAIANITSTSSNIENGSYNKPTGKNYGQLQSELQQLAGQVDESAAEMTAVTSNPSKLGQESSYFSGKTIQLLTTGAQLASMQQEITVKEEIIVTLKNISIVTSNLLIVAKSVASNPDAPGAKNQLNSAARAVSESLNQLIDACSSASPGQKECENAVRRIQGLKQLLDNPSEPLNNFSYFDCQQIVVEKSKLLGDSMTGITNHAKEGQLDLFGSSVNSSADAVCGLIEAAAQAAYLLGASDPTSIAGRPGLVDIHAINESAKQIKLACSNLATSKVTQSQILSSATAIAKHTSSLCNACRSASERTTDPTTKRQFVQLAKEVANATGDLVKDIKALESAANPDKVGGGTANLIRSVNSLVNYASQPEFSPISAKISSKGRQNQEPISSAGKNVIEGSSRMLQSAQSLAINPKDPPTWQQIAEHSKHVSAAIKNLVTALREKAPGQKECENAVTQLNDLLSQLNQASLAAVSSSLTPRKDNTLQGFVQSSENSLRMAEEHIERLRHAGKTEAETLGHAVSAMVSIIQNLVGSIVGVSSNILETKEQVNIIERSKTVLESAIQFIIAAKDSGGNPKATRVHPELDLSSQCFQEGLDDLKSTLERISSGAGGIVASLTESLTASMIKLDSPNHHYESDEGYVDFQTRMVNSAKEIARLSQEMVSKSTMDPAHLPQLSSEISHHYIQLANDARGAIATSISTDIGTRLRCGVQELGRGIIELVRTGGSVTYAPNDQFALRDLSDCNRTISEKVSDILAALQAGSRGTQACINAASTVSGIIGDLDTTIMFATAGTLHAEGDEKFADHRDNILRTAKALVDDTRTLVAGATATQEQLALAAQNAVSTIVQLSEAVKFGAASLGSNNPESQVMLINSVRDVAGALYDFIHSTKSAAGKGKNDPSMLALKESAQIMVTNVTSLLKTVKAVEDEHTRGTRALEATIEAIAQEIRAFDSSEVPRSKTVTAEELVRVTKPVTMATGKAVAAGNSCRQEDIIVAANMGRKVISDILTTSKIAAYSVDGDLRERLLAASRGVGMHYRELLQIILHGVNHPGADVKPQLSNSSREIAISVTEIVAVGQLMKVLHNQVSSNPLLGHSYRQSSTARNNNQEGNEFEDPDDPTVIAENELLGAANSIDAAAKKLEKLRPRRSIKETDETLNFDEMILEAAKSIAAATSALVKAASAAQRELVDSGRVSRKVASDSDDGQWAEGLVSAAQMVAAATHSLVEAANLLVQGHATEEKLISAAKQVASSTAQLLVACNVKASPDSDSTRRLQAAGKAVIRATDNLVRAARQALSQEEEHQIVLQQKKVGSIAQVIDARAEVLRIEKELEEARKKLAVIHKAKYHEQPGGAGAGGGTDESDIEYETVQTPRYNTDSRLDSLLENQAERINSASSSFKLMNLSTTPTSSTPPAVPLKPAISPKPTQSQGSFDRTPRMTNASPAYSTVSNESNISQPQYHQPPPPPPIRTFYSAGPGTSEELYSRPMRMQQQQQQASSTSPTGSVTSTKKIFMKPSEFLPSPSSQTSASMYQQSNKPTISTVSHVVPPNNGHGFSHTGNEAYNSNTSTFTISSPVVSQSQSEIETVNPDGSISLKRIFTQQEQTTSSKVNVTSSRKFFQQQQQQHRQQSEN